jgi:hypothetical protein
MDFLQKRNRSLPAALLSMTAMLAACSSESDGAAEAENAVVGSETYDPDYKVFKTRADAVQWFEGSAPLLAATGVVSKGVVPGDDPRTQRMQAIVEQEWEKIREIFSPNIPLPHVIVFETDAPNAFISFDPNVKKIADLVLVHAPLMEYPEIEGTIAHELGHLVLKHTNPQYSAAMTRYYRAVGGEPLGLLTGDDPAVKTIVGPWIDDVGTVGSFGGKELNGAPVDTTASAAFVFLRAYTRANAVGEKSACKAFQEGMRTASQILTSSTIDGKLTLSDENRTALDQATHGLTSAAKDCLPSTNEPLLETMAKTLGLPADATANVLRADDLEAIAGLPTLDALFTLTERAHARVRTVRKSKDFESYRSYTSEEEADDFSMTVLHSLGKDPEALGRELVGILPPEQQALCETALAQGVPYYGLADAHHSTCYRMYHSRKFAEYLRSGGVGVTPARIPHAAPPATREMLPRYTQN